MVALHMAPATGSAQRQRPPLGRRLQQQQQQLALGRLQPLLSSSSARSSYRRCARAVRAQQQQDGSQPAAAAEAATAAPADLSSSSGSTAAPPNDDEPEFALVLIACGVGLATGAAIVGFNVGVHWIRDVIWEGETLLSADRTLLRNIGESELWPKIVFPPLLGGLAVGGLGALIGGYDEKPKPKVKPSSSGSGGSSDDAAAGHGPASSALAVEQLQLQAGAVVRPVARALAAIMTLGTGASLGPEGPSVDIGKSTATGFGSMLRSKQRHLTSLIAAGAGAGVAAGFNAPVAGVFFAVETVLQKQKLSRPSSSGDLGQQVSNTVSSLQPSGLTVAMVLLASVLAAVVSQAGLGASPAFRVPEYRLESMWELPLYLLLGGVCGVVSASFSFSTRVATDAFDELRSQNSFEAALMPCIGGLTTGVLALGYPEILYQGFDNVNNILSGGAAGYAPGLLIQIVVMKVIATSICRGSGLQGGLYAPSIFIGAALGTAFGLLAHVVGDPAGLELAAPQAYALVGIAAMLASNCSVPLTSVLLLFELTRDYLIILPTMAAVGISFWISSLAAPSVKNAAAARRMSATAAASAAVATTQLNARAAEAVLVGSLQQQGKLSKATSGLPGSAAPVGAARLAADAGSAAGLAAPPAGSGTTAAAAVTANTTWLEEECSLDWSDGSRLDSATAGPAQLAAAAARCGRELLVGAALERSCLLVEAEMPVQQALELMQADDQNVAVVLGEDGGVVGLVTRDVLEECVEAAAAQAAAASSSSSDSDAGSGGGGPGAGKRSRAAAKARSLVVRAEAEASAGKAAVPPPPPTPLRSVGSD